MNSYEFSLWQEVLLEKGASVLGDLFRLKRQRRRDCLPCFLRQPEETLRLFPEQREYFPPSFPDNNHNCQDIR